MDDFAVIYPFMQTVIQNGEVGLSGLDHPVRHRIGGKIDPVGLEYPGLPVQRHCVRVLGVHDGRDKRWCSDAVPEQVGRTGRFPDDAGVLFGSVYMDMVLVHNKGFRDDVKTFVDLFRKFFIAFREQGRQFFL